MNLMNNFEIQTIFKGAYHFCEYIGWKNKNYFSFKHYGIQRLSCNKILLIDNSRNNIKQFFFSQKKMETKNEKTKNIFVENLERNY